MTDAATAPGLTDLWNLFLSVAARQPIELRVLGVLAVLLALVLIVDGIRANVRREKPVALHIERLPHTPTRAVQVRAAPPKTRTLKAFKVKQPARKTKSFKPPRPGINRVSPEEPRNTYQPSQGESVREEPEPPL